MRHEVELYCNVDSIPRIIEIDLDGLDIGDSVHISMVKLPEGVRPTITDRDFTIAQEISTRVSKIAGATDVPVARGAARPLFRPTHEHDGNGCLRRDPRGGVGPARAPQGKRPRGW